LNHKR